jgi:hypothetical protein
MVPSAHIRYRIIGFILIALGGCSSEETKHTFDVLHAKMDPSMVDAVDAHEGLINNKMDIDNDANASGGGNDLQEEQHFILEQEYVEDDDSDISFNIEEVEDAPTDDELEYDTVEKDSDDERISVWKEYISKDIEIKPKGYKPDASPPSQMGEDSKALLLWRRDGNETSLFSDWRIKVVAETDAGEETVSIYNVHRVTLASGPKKCGYFEALLQSDCFSENSESMCTVKLPEEIAAHFPDFLDYLYAQPYDSKCAINFENWKSMRYLANYFLVPRLTEEVGDFIEEDMKNYNHERIADYVSEFNRDITDDMSRRILPEATVACAEMILSIESDSTLLSIIPPAMFLKIMRTALSVGEDGERCISLEKRIHVMSLLVTYLDQSEEVDGSTFVIYFCNGYCGGGPELGLHYRSNKDEVNDAVLVSRAEIALQWFSLIKRRGWEAGGLYDINGDIKSDSYCCEWILSDLFLLSETPPSLALMERIVKEAPSDVVARLFRDVAEKGTDWRYTQFYGNFAPASAYVAS